MSAIHLPHLWSHLVLTFIFPGLLMLLSLYRHSKQKVLANTDCLYFILALNSFIIYVHWTTSTFRKNQNSSVHCDRITCVIRYYSTWVRVADSHTLSHWELQARLVSAHTTKNRLHLAISLSHLQPGLEFFTEVILQLQQNKIKEANISNLLINKKWAWNMLSSVTHAHTEMG